MIVEDASVYCTRDRCADRCLGQAILDARLVRGKLHLQLLHRGILYVDPLPYPHYTDYPL